MKKSVRIDDNAAADGNYSINNATIWDFWMSMNFRTFDGVEG